MSDYDWGAWSRDVNAQLATLDKRLKRAEQVVLPGKGRSWVLADVLGKIMRALRAEMLEGDNAIRAGTGLPIVKPRVRIKAGSAPWP